MPASDQLRDEGAKDLRPRALRATIAAFSAQGLKFLLHVAIGITLARLITPEDFGLFAIAFTVTGFLEFAKEGGMVVPAVQSEALTPAQMDTLFWFNAGLGLVVTFVAMLAAPLAGYFYADARLVPITAVLALMFLMGGIGTQYRASLRRQMRFARLNLCEIAAMAAASCVAVIAALQGARYWSLVWFHLILETAQTVLMILASGWRPRWPRPWAAIGPLVRFGGTMMAFDFIGYFNFKLDNLIVAWFLGPAALGFYDKAYQFLLLPVNQISVPLSGVVHSTLSRLQRDPERYRNYLSRSLLLAASLGLPITAFLWANARIVIGQLLGSQWLPSVPIFQALGPAAFLMTITTCVGWIFLSLGRAGRQLRWAALSTVITVAAFFAGVPWGATGVALAFSISRALLFVPTLMFTCANTPVPWTAILKTVVRPGFAAAAAMLVCIAVDSVLPESLWSLPRNAALFATVYALGWILPPGGWHLVRETLLLTRGLYRNA